MISRDRKALHEASHYVIAQRLGALILHCSIQPPRTEYFLVAPTLAAQAHGHIMIGMAGYLAERLLLGPCPTDTAAGDRADFRARLRNCCHRSPDPHHARRLARFAAALVLRHRDAIRGRGLSSGRRWKK